MPKPTIKSLEAQITTLQELKVETDRHEKWQSAEICRLRELAKMLETDKLWLQRMHSAVLQSMHEYQKGRN